MERYKPDTGPTITGEEAKAWIVHHRETYPGGITFKALAQKMGVSQKSVCLWWYTDAIPKQGAVLRRITAYRVGVEAPAGPHGAEIGGGV